MAKEKYDVLEIKDRLDEIENWYRNGSLDKEVADHLGISHSLLYKWIERSVPDIESDFKGDGTGYDKKYKAFADARQRGKKTSNATLENVAFSLATGNYIHRETVYTYNEGQFITNSFNKKLKPDQNMLWRLMQNRMPDKYREKVDISHSGNLESSVRLLRDFSDDQLNAIREMAVQGKQDLSSDYDAEEGEEEVSIDEDDLYE